MTFTELNSIKKNYNTLVTIELMLEEVCVNGNEDANNKIEKALKLIKKANEITHYCLFHAQLEKLNELKKNESIHNKTKQTQSKDE